MYEQLRSLILSDEESQLSAVPHSTIDKIKVRYPGIPTDYLAFLTDVGWGTFAMAYVVYEAPKKPEEIFGQDEDSALTKFVFFGDDMTGRFAGFDINDWKVVELLQDRKTVLSKWTTFDEFIRHICDVLFEVEA